jgi:hypothetical protein
MPVGSNVWRCHMKIDCTQATIMIIDDEPENLNVLSDPQALPALKNEKVRDIVTERAERMLRLPEAIIP